MLGEREHFRYEKYSKMCCNINLKPQTDDNSCSLKIVNGYIIYEIGSFEKKSFVYNQSIW